LQALGDVVHLHAALLFRQLARDRLDHLVPRIADRVHGVAKADDHFPARHPLAGVSVGLAGELVAILQHESDLVCTAVLMPAQGAGWPCSRCRKWPPMESSSVSTSMTRPLWL